MVEKRDIRWQQRLDNFDRALQTLVRVAGAVQPADPSEMEQLALIQTFEFTHELAWKMLKDYLEAKGHTGIAGSRDAARKAWEFGIIEDGDLWMAMIDDRNQTSHTYDQTLAARIAQDVLHRCQPEFTGLLHQFTAIRDLAEAPR